jgi:hypothetical protein
VVESVAEMDLFHSGRKWANGVVVVCREREVDEGGEEGDDEVLVFVHAGGPGDPLDQFGGIYFHGLNSGGVRE